MDGNNPLPPGPPPQQWPQPYPAAPAPQTRRWMPAAIVAAAIIVAAAALADVMERRLADAHAAA
ncbi:MAG: hypothetical protein R2763_01295 [Mycobacterium sp.]